jgi:membrane protein
MPRRAIERLKNAGRLFWQTLDQFIADACPQMAAAISFYAIFSLPPLLVLVIMLVEPLLDAEAVQRVMEREAGQFLGPHGAAQVETLLENVSRPGQGGPVAIVIGGGAFLFGATAAFGQLQAALNAAWQVGPDPSRGDIVNFLFKRALSFAMILTIGALLLGSLVLTALLGAFGDTLLGAGFYLPTAAVLRVLDAALSFSVVAMLFTAMYRYLPDAEVRWSAALFGGTTTAVFFAAGKAAIGYYLGQSDPGSAFGAAGSLAMVLIWLYYSSMVLLLGAEFTQVWMCRRGEPIQPEPGAVRVIRRKERHEPDEAPAGREGDAA